MSLSTAPETVGRACAPGTGVLLTDLYQLTMAQAYEASGMHATAAFELSVRRLPAARRFLLAAGLEQVLDYLEQLRFEAGELEYLAGLGLFSPAFLERLAALRFTGDVEALAEGTPFFADEPVLRVSAPIVEAQLVESRVLNLVHFQTLVASKAVRSVMVGGGCPLVDFGMRRAHGAEAALLAARAAYLAGFDATATVEAGRRFGIPLSGTMAHSFIEAHDRETGAFRHFLEATKQPTTLLIDTYDTERAAREVAVLARAASPDEPAGRIRAVRIDSGDLAAQAQSVRRILDAHDCQAVRIVLSGGLDEYALERLRQARAPADAFGIGTHMVVSEDAPSLDMAYKLVEYHDRPRRKSSPGKTTWPGRKQVFRRSGRRSPDAPFTGDSLALAHESLAGEPLLQPVMRRGRRLGSSPPLAQLRALCARQIARLPASLRVLEPGPGDYPVEMSEALAALARAMQVGGAPT